MNRRVCLILALLGSAPVVRVEPLAAQTPAAIGCELCHGELEFLRAQTGSLAEAQRLFSTSATVRESAHNGMDCAECHSGFGRFPHATGSATRSCGSCHEAAAMLWQTGVHADPSTADPVSCSACHDIHDVMGGDVMATEVGAGRMNAHCTVCHESSHLSPSNPHALAVPCSGCHAPHDTRRVDDEAARVAPARQYETCRGCHEEETEGWTSDAHGMAVLESSSAAAGAGAGHGRPTCTACHGAHDMLTIADPAFNGTVVQRCSECHEEAAETYLETYHGQASALGSKIVATCSACHGNHDILPAADPASAVADQNRLATCGECHEQARASFVLYDSHPHPGDRERSAILYFTFLFMNILLIGVFSVFGLHTILWWARLLTGHADEAPETGEHHG